MHRAYPALFVFLWSTGFIGAKFGLPYAAPLTFLVTRFLLVVLLMSFIALVARAPWPQSGRHWFHIGVTGVLMHAFFLGGVFLSLSQGFPTALCSLVVGLQPILTAIGASIFLGEHTSKRQWLGLTLGLTGIILVLAGRISAGFGFEGIPASVFALVSITIGTLYQKRFCPSFDWRTGSVAQFIPAAVIAGIGAYFFESFRLAFTVELVFALAWLVIVLSVVAMGLLNYLIRSGSAVSVVSLFYLVPATTAALAFVLFQESLSVMAILGIIISLWGVSLSRGGSSGRP